MRTFKPLLLCSAILAAYPALAQNTAASGDNSTVTVTARRVGELLQDVPLSIRALSGAELQEKGIGSISELSLYTPGLSYSQDFGRTQERPVIRGISALRPEAPQPVSVFIDGVYMRDGVLGVLLDDAQRVEVIKGPQSALYGRATYMGAINYITKKPGNEATGRLSVTSATAGEHSIFGAMTLPLIKDTLSARFKFKSNDYGGQYTNTLTGNKIGQEATDAVGLAVSFTPTRNFDAMFTFDKSNDRDGLFAAVARTVPVQVAGVITNPNGTTNLANGATCDGKTINIVGNNAQGIPDAAVPPSVTNRLNGWPCGPATFTGTLVQRNETNLANYTDPKTGINYGDIAGLDRGIHRSTMTLNYTFGGGYMLTSQSAHTRQYANLGADQSYSAVPFAPATVGGTSWLSYNRDILRYSSQEFRVQSPVDRALTWLAGVYIYKEDTEGMTGNGVIARNAAGAIVAAPLGLTPTSASHVRDAAPFARVQYEFSKALRASVEGRYTQEEVKVGGTPLGTAVVTAGSCTAGQICSINGNKTFKDFAPRLTVDFKANKDMLLYGQWAKGVKSGGFNATAGLPDAVFAYDGETVKAAEFGVKSVWLGGRASINAAVFQNNIEGLQLSNISTVVNPLTGQSTTATIVNNVGKARTKGFEIEGRIRPTDWLTISGNYAYTDAKAIEGTEITNGTVFGGNRSVAGFTLPRSPKDSAAVSFAVNVPAGAGMRFFATTDVVYQSRRYAEIQNMIWADPFTRINASLGLSGAGWRVTGWVKNAANDNTSLNGFRYLDPGTFRRTAVDFLPRLRQYGLTAAYDF
jgi:iron complex outermembrane recepter protein